MEEQSSINLLELEESPESTSQNTQESSGIGCL